MGKLTNLISYSLLAALFALGAILLPWLDFNNGVIVDGVKPWSYRSDLQDLIYSTVAGEDGEYGVAVKQLETGETAGYNTDIQSASASLYKLAVLYGVYKKLDDGELTLDDELVMTGEDAIYVDDEDLTIPIGGSTTVRDAIFQMITVSDNSSAILLLHYIGAETLNSMMRDLGLTQTEIGIGDVALTSPDDILLLLEKIYNGEGVTGSARQGMIDVLLQQTVNDRIPAYLPEGTPVAHKTGELGDVRNDAGIVFAPNGPYIIVVMSHDLSDVDRGVEVIASLSEKVYAHFTASS